MQPPILDHLPPDVIRALVIILAELENARRALPLPRKPIWIGVFSDDATTVALVERRITDEQIHCREHRRVTAASVARLRHYVEAGSWRIRDWPPRDWDATAIRPRVTPLPD